MATKANKDYENVIHFINQYRSSISDDVVNSGEYAFKAFLIQVANHKSQDSLQFRYAYTMLEEIQDKTGK